MSNPEARTPEKTILTPDRVGIGLAALPTVVALALVIGPGQGWIPSGVYLYLLVPAGFIASAAIAAGVRIRKGRQTPPEIPYDLRRARGLVILAAITCIPPTASGSPSVPIHPTSSHCGFSGFRSP